jgi:single-strand DNA-binding protein
MNCTLTGTAKLGAEPELRFTGQGKAVCELRLAFSNSKKKRGEEGYEYTPAVWVSATLWEKMAENAAEMLHKGDEVFCSGLLELERFDKKDGTQGEKLTLRAAEVAPSIRRGLPAAVSDTRRPAPAARPQASPQPVSRQPEPPPW